MAAPEAGKGAPQWAPKREEYPLCRVHVYEAPGKGVVSCNRTEGEALAGLSLVSPYFSPDVQLSPKSDSLLSLLNNANKNDAHHPHDLSFSSIFALSVHPTVQTLAAKLREGTCIAFPTETVYGLGAVATIPNAVNTIYTLKRRPPSDPLICHVVSARQALEQVIDLDAEAPGAGSASLGAPQGGPLRRVFEALAEAFWPGPLSIIAKQRPLSGVSHEGEGFCGTEGGGPKGGPPSCRPGVADAVTAGTGFVAVRVPHHAIALSLLAAVGAPVAAPSANRFGRISPTSAEHVVKQFDIKQQQQQQQEETEGVYHMPVLDGGECCAVGIESTVVKLITLGGPPEGVTQVEVRVLRRGLISPHMLSEALTNAVSAAPTPGAPPFPLCVVTVSPSIKYRKEETGAPSEGAQGSLAAAPAPRGEETNGIAGAPRGPPTETEGPSQESPGLCLTHYSPCVPSFLLENAARCFELLGAPGEAPRGAPGGVPVYPSRRCVLIDGDGSLASLSGYFYKYITLAQQKKGARRGLFIGGPPEGTDGEEGSEQMAAAAAARGVFGALHAAEEAALQQQQEQQQQQQQEQQQGVVLLHAEPLVQWGEGGLSVYDRLFR